MGVTAESWAYLKLREPGYQGYVTPERPDGIHGDHVGDGFPTFQSDNSSPRDCCVPMIDISTMTDASKGKKEPLEILDFRGFFTELPIRIELMTFSLRVKRSTD